MDRNNRDLPKKLLVIRFSAIGDVAMTVPVLYSLAVSYPQCEITMLSNARFASFFCGLPSNFHFLGVDLKKDYHGSNGLNRLQKELNSYHFDAVADLHGVLRTAIISTRFRLQGVTVRRIQKGRIHRFGLVRLHLKNRKQQTTSFEKYKNVLSQLGFVFKLNFRSIFGSNSGDINQISMVTGEKSLGKWVGVAPFAAHQGKIYPINMMEIVVSMINALPSVEKIFVFAYGTEKDQISDWNEKYDKIDLIGGKLRMDQELILISHLNVMLAMDSSNMHLSSLTSTPVVSIWGATHTNAGFMGYGQSLDDCVQMDFPCRPCSIYGSRACRYGDYHCMTSITPQMVIDKLDKYIL